MKVLTIGKGLIGDDGKVVTGQTISSVDPDKIVYTGGVPSEEEMVRKWAAKGKREFSNLSRKEPIKKVVEKEIIPFNNPESNVKKDKKSDDEDDDVNPSFLTYT